MGYVIANIGNNSNVPTWDIRCDDLESRDELDTKKIPPGSTAYIMDGEAKGALYMLNTNKEWIEQ